jgi:hypothetical protein
MIRQHTGISVFVAEPCHDGLDQSSQEIIDQKTIPLRIPMSLPSGKPIFVESHVKIPIPNPTRSGGDTGTGRTTEAAAEIFIMYGLGTVHNSEPHSNDNITLGWRGDSKFWHPTIESEG